MVNKEHIHLLKHGAERWDEWRSQHPPQVKPDQSGAGLGGTDLLGTY